MKIKQTLLALALIVGIGGFVFAPVVSAGSCGWIDTAIINCDVTEGSEVQNTGIWGLLILVLNILSAGIGVVGVGGIVYGSILYASAGGSMEETKAAKKIIFNVIIGLITYAFMYSFLNFLIPGGFL
jgi:hypothetical protein